MSSKPDSPFAPPIQAIMELPWGAWSLISLYLSLFSGVVVGLQYDYQTPFYSASALDILVPYGEFFRSLHFYSSQLFFLFCCVHLIATYATFPKTHRFEWIKLTATLPVILLLLFTGYILRGDSTGSSAGYIAESIIQSIPLLGQPLNHLFFSLSESGLRKVYVHHVIGLDILLLFLAWKHLRTYRVNIRDHLMVTSCIIFFCILITAPMEPEKAGVTYISGPWFFLGLQELLRYLYPFIAGVIVPLSFITALFLLFPGSVQNERRRALLFLLWWLGVYTVLTGIAWLR